MISLDDLVASQKATLVDLDQRGWELLDILEYYEGPLAETYRDGRGNYWLSHWADCGPKNTEPYRWLVIPTSKFMVELYKTRRISYYELVRNPTRERCYLKDAYRAARSRSVIMKFEDVTEDYLPPSKDTYYEPPETQ
jgi:hypothetical protein